MITRRGFFGALGKAIIGTALVLKLPDSIIPSIPKLGEKINISFRVLHEAYVDCMKGSIEPDLLIVSGNTYSKIKEYLFREYSPKPCIPFYPEENFGEKEIGIRFMGAYIRKSRFSDHPDNQLLVLGGYKNERYYL